MSLVRCTLHNVGCAWPTGLYVALAEQPGAVHSRCRPFTMPSSLCCTQYAAEEPAAGPAVRGCRVYVAAVELGCRAGASRL